MRIGIVTFFDNGNYGSELQSLAMNDFLKERGHQPFFCNIKHSLRLLQAIEARFNVYKKRMVCFLDNEVKEYQRDMMNNVTKQKTISPALRCQIHDYVSSHLSMVTVSPFSFMTRNKFDAFICGSDQIWSALKLPLQPLNFLYGISRNKKIAYAPSMGLDVLPHYYIKQVRKYICDFKYLSVRENTAKKVILDHYGIAAQQVLDPTLLVGREYWDRQLDKHPKLKSQENYVFCYFLGEIEPVVKTSIEKVANGKTVIILPYEEDSTKVLNGQYVLADPLDFVYLIKNADCVLTDSFHGSVFSILYDKQFAVTKRTHLGKVSQTSRILSLLRLFGLDKQYCAGSNEIVKACNTTIDYNQIHPLLAAQQEASRCFLDSALLEIENLIHLHE